MRVCVYVCVCVWNFIVTIKNLPTYLIASCVCSHFLHKPTYLPTVIVLVICDFRDFMSLGVLVLLLVFLSYLHVEFYWDNE